MKRTSPGGETDDDLGAPAKSAKLTPPDSKRGPSQRLTTDHGGDESRAPDQAYIKRIKMHNFLPHDDCEVYPGQRLNLVVGPNGSGKSAISDCICLCLAGNPKGIGRCENIKDWIRNGQEECVIEIDLSHPEKASGVVTIRRRLTRNSQSNQNSQFWISDRGNFVAKKEKEVSAFVKALGVQLDNMCHYLPQNKVEEFAQLAGKPTELLFKVEEAVGSNDMKELHEKLIKMQTNVVSDLKELQDKTERREKQRERKQEIELEMRKFAELEEKKNRADLMERIIPYRHHREASIKYKNQKEVCKPLEEALADAKATVNDLKEKERLAKQKYESARKDVDISEGDLRRFETKAKETAEKLTSMEGEFEDLKRQIKENNKRITEKEAKMEKASEEVKGLKETLAKKGKEPPDLDNRIKQANATFLELSKKVTNKQQEVQAGKNHLRTIESDKISKQKEIRDFKSVQRIKIENLSQKNRKAYEAYEYLQQNADRFEKKVLGPLCLEISTADRESAAYIEMSLGQEKFSFIVQSDRDYNTINKIAQGMQSGHAIKEATFLRHTDIRVPAEDLQGITAAKLHEYSINGTLISRVQAPDVVRSYLCQEKMFHRKPIGSRETYAKMEAIVNDLSLIEVKGNGKKQHKLQQVLTPDHVITTSFSIYGSKQMSTKVDAVKPAYTIIPGNDARLDAIKQELCGLEDKEAASRRELEVLEREEQELRTQHIGAQQHKSALIQEKGMYDTKTSIVIIQKKEKDIRDLANEIERLKRTLPDLKRRLGQEHSRRYEEAAKLKSFTDRVTESVLKVLITQAEIEPFKDDLKKCTDRVRAAGDDVFDKEGIYKAENMKLKAFETQMQKWKQRKSEDRNQLSKHEKELLQPGAQQMRVTGRPWDVALADVAIPGGNWETAKEWEEKLEDLQTEIEAIGIVNDFAQELDDINEELATLERDIPILELSTSSHSAQVEDKKKAWLDGNGSAEKPGLRGLVDTVNRYFSDTFAKLGNVGQVELHEAKDANNKDDFKNYGINIKVKFRAKQDLQLLNANVQSGGEKSLSIMLFILALQDMIKVPFRVVDEINQGMDKHYERAIFERIVEQGGMLDNVGTDITVLALYKGRDMCKHSVGGKQGRF